MGSVWRLSTHGISTLQVLCRYLQVLCRHPWDRYGISVFLLGLDMTLMLIAAVGAVHAITTTQHTNKVKQLLANKPIMHQILILKKVIMSIKCQ